jgi:hypothetical protein
MSRLMSAQACFFLEHDQACARLHFQKLHGGRKAHDAATDNTIVVNHVLSLSAELLQPVRRYIRQRVARTALTWLSIQ